MTEDQPNPRLQALLTLLNAQDDENAVEFSDELAQAASMERLSKQYIAFDTGINPSLIAGLSRQLSKTGTQQAQKPKPGKNFELTLPKPETDYKVKAGEKIVCNQYDSETKNEKVLFGVFLEFANKIVTMKDRKGKKRYLFNSERYSWVVRPIADFPDFPDNFDA